MDAQLLKKKVPVAKNWYEFEKFNAAFSDEKFWGDHPKYYATIRQFEFNNGLFLIARSKKGLTTWMFEKTINQWTLIDEFFPVLSDETHWDKPEYFMTITPIVFNQELFLIARDKKGLITWMFDKPNMKWKREPIDEFFPVFSDEKFWNKPEYYATIKPFFFMDKLFLIARAKDGLVTFIFNEKDMKWKQAPIDQFFPVFSDEKLSDKPEYYSTIKPFVFQDKLFLIARDKEGLITFIFNEKDMKWKRAPIDKFFPEFSDMKMWNKPEYYYTIQPVPVKDKLFLLARSSKGLITFLFDMKEMKWKRTPIDEFVPEFSDQRNWNKPEYYSSIKPLAINKKLFLMARDKRGMFTWTFNMPSN
ncbi:MAG: hypothetical protein KJO50_00495 [Bacteroidia bacterium]|nr:hypothetical protein [Bacteroidia bacterium]